MLTSIFICIISPVRATIVHSLKRAGYPLTFIMKLTGHKTLKSLVKSYDLKLDTKERVNMSAAIGFGAQLS